MSAAHPADPAGILVVTARGSDESGTVVLTGSLSYEGADAVSRLSNQPHHKETQ